MPSSTTDETLRNLAILYLALAHGADDYLSDAELNAVVNRLEHKFPPALTGRSVHESVMQTIAVYTDASDPLALVTDAMRALRASLTTDERVAFLHDLSHVARADGVVFRDERGILESLAACWDVELLDEALMQPLVSDSRIRLEDDVFEDLAFLYLVLGHGTDFELSDSEMRMMLRRLEEWQPHKPVDHIRAVLENAMNRYAEGPSEEALASAIAAIKRRLPHAQRMAALNDLVKIANADGVFLDDEEDLINRLLTEWEVEAYANYGAHGSKG
jgi:uncharacterized tellurite resistance protein B-like protein